MSLWRLPLKLAGILLLAGLASGAWLFRHQLLALARPRVERVTDALDERTGRPSPASLARARDKVDSLNGWAGDSIVLTAGEMASLLNDGLPAEVRQHMDSLRLTLSDGRVAVEARLETRALPADVLGPLAGALDPWETVRASGTLARVADGHAAWTVDAVTLRGFTLPEPVSRAIVQRALAGTAEGAVRFALPRGVGGLMVRPGGVVLYREGSR
jgi:hypothetical protein